jgi:hypothetical protein
MHGNGLHQNHFGKASQRWDVPITVSRRSFIRFTFWMDQELAMLEARWGGEALAQSTQIDKPRFRSTDRLF